MCYISHAIGFMAWIHQRLQRPEFDHLFPFAQWYALAQREMQLKCRLTDDSQKFWLFNIAMEHAPYWEFWFAIATLNNQRVFHKPPGGWTPKNCIITWWHPEIVMQKKHVRNHQPKEDDSKGLGAPRTKSDSNMADILDPATRNRWLSMVINWMSRWAGLPRWLNFCVLDPLSYHTPPYVDKNPSCFSGLPSGNLTTGQSTEGQGRLISKYVYEVNHLQMAMLYHVLPPKR